MASFPLVCTACSCLCDDLIVDVEGERITRIENACVRGAAFIYASQKPERRTACLVQGQPTSPEAALAEAARLLKQARQPLIFGLDNSTLEAQAAGLRLAEALGATLRQAQDTALRQALPDQGPRAFGRTQYRSPQSGQGVTLDDTSSFCHGAAVQAILEGRLPTCTLDEVKAADTVVYWGANPYHSHPRHLAKFSYYPRDKFRDAGWIPDVTLTAVEVRDTETTSLCRPLFKLRPGEDGQFLREVLAVARGRETGKAAGSLAEIILKSRFCVIFIGLGLVYALDNELSSFFDLVSELGRERRLAVIPMVGHYNTLGFNYTLFHKTGFINRLHFNGHVQSGPQFSFLEQVRQRQADLLFVIGTDPLSSQPASLMKNLEGVPIICLDPLVTATSQRAAVVLGGAVSGLECGGSARRMDGAILSLTPFKTGGLPSDEDFLHRICDGVTA